MVHDFDPILVTIYGDLAIRWYGLSYVAGFLASYFLILVGAKTEAGFCPR